MRDFVRVGEGAQRQSRIPILVWIAALAVAAQPAAAATYTDADGHSVDVVSTAPVPTPDQLYLDVLFGLVHGAEMDSLTVHLTATDAEHQTVCGGAAGCYTFGDTPGTLFVRGFDTGDDPNDDADNVAYTAQTIPRGLIAHEYGHHVANYRTNDGPLEGGALANGTKRWATYVGICPQVRAGKLGNDYATSPAEGFAESYRALHFPENLGFWFLDPLLKPDQTALDLIREDVLNPYTGPTRAKVKGRFKQGGKDRQRKKLKTPLDGELTASLKTTGSLKAKLALAGGAKGKGRKQKLDDEVCGTRTARFSVKRVRGKGRYTVKATRP
jgi:hypothetical protein